MGYVGGCVVVLVFGIYGWIFTLALWFSSCCWFFGIYDYFELFLWFRPLSDELLFACSRKE